MSGYTPPLKIGDDDLSHQNGVIGIKELRISTSQWEMDSFRVRVLIATVLSVMASQAAYMQPESGTSETETRENTKCKRQRDPKKTVQVMITPDTNASMSTLNMLSAGICASQVAATVTAVCMSRQRLMFHSEQGSVYRSKVFRRLLWRNGVIQSMSGKLKCLAIPSIMPPEA